MKKAFTLIELLVVIGIIGVLSAVLLGTFSKASESALSAACMVNMRSLATAWQTASEEKTFPTPGPSESPYVIGGSGNQFKNTYFETPGWISWDSRGLYNNHRADSSQEASCKRVGLYSADFESVQFALSNGSVYKHLSGNTSTYVCPVHKKKRPDANWSYLMNDQIRKKRDLDGKQRDRLLLFAEVPFRSNSPGEWFPSDEAWSTETDAALQVDGDVPENIGVNHMVGNDWVAHVAFTDGHVEKLRIGKNMTGDNLRELSKYLVEGLDITYNAEANKYEKIQ